VEWDGKGGHGAPRDAQETAACLQILDRLEELEDAEIDED
jgi:hypothetical protein